MVCLRMSLVASCYIWQCGLIWQVSSTISLPSRKSNWENSTWTDFIPHSAHSKYFWQRHMVERSAQQQAAQPQAWAVFTWLFQATCTFRQAMYAIFTCRQAGRPSHTLLWLKHRHRGKWEISAEPQIFLPYSIRPNALHFFPKHHNVYKYNSIHCFRLLLLNHVHQLTWSQTICLQTITLHARCWL